MIDDSHRATTEFPVQDKVADLLALAFTNGKINRFRDCVPRWQNQRSVLVRLTTRRYEKLENRGAAFDFIAVLQVDILHPLAANENSVRTTQIHQPTGRWPDF